MMRHAARTADIWSSLSFLDAFDGQLDETRRRVVQIAEACDAVGRDPATLRRSFTMYDATARPRGGTYECYTSVGRFEAMVGPLLELGMDEIVLYYPPDEGQLPTFERIATDVLPRLRDRPTTA
jgi:hypothetical protein